jgi:branched-subunit amino acid ABC-type transport system permease component
VLTIHGWDITQQMIVVGVGRGLAYAVLAAGIVLVYRASGVINFAQGAFGAFGIGLMAVLVGTWHGCSWPPGWCCSWPRWAWPS